MPFIKRVTAVITMRDGADRILTTIGWMGLGGRKECYLGCLRGGVRKRGAHWRIWIALTCSF